MHKQANCSRQNPSECCVLLLIQYRAAHTLQSSSVACMLGMALLLNAQQRGVKGDTEQKSSRIPCAHSPRGCQKKSYLPKNSLGTSLPMTLLIMPPSQVLICFAANNVSLSHAQDLLLCSVQDTLQLYSGSDQLGLLNLLHSGGELMPLSFL